MSYQTGALDTTLVNGEQVDQVKGRYLNSQLLVQATYGMSARI